MRLFGFIGFGSSWYGSFRPEAERKVRPLRRKEGITSEGFGQPSRSPRSSFQPSRQPERADGRWPIAKKEFTSTPWQSSYRRPALSVTNGCEPLLQHPKEKLCGRRMRETTARPPHFDRVLSSLASAFVLPLSSLLPRGYQHGCAVVRDAAAAGQATCCDSSAPSPARRAHLDRQQHHYRQRPRPETHLSDVRRM